MSYQLFAFFMGLFGSLHCIAMCGPLLVAMPVGRTSRWRILVNTLSYQMGRTLIYGVLGTIVGGMGHLIGASGWQQGLSIAIGILLVGSGLISISGQRFHRIARIQQSLMQPVIRWIGYWFSRPGGHIVVGMLNGILPCGMVYMALAMALNAETVQESGAFMLRFGLGTWPAMFAVAIAGNLMKRRTRINLAFWLPVICLLLGGWFMLRGAGLNIQFLSPLIYPDGAVTCNK